MNKFLCLSKHTYNRGRVFHKSYQNILTFSRLQGMIKLSKLVANFRFFSSSRQLDDSYEK